MKSAKRKNTTIISEGVNGRNQNLLQKLARRCYKEAVEQILHFAALGKNNKKAKIELFSEGGNGRIPNLLQKHLEEGYKEAIYRIWMPYDNGNLVKSCTSFRCVRLQTEKKCENSTFFVRRKIG